MKRILCLLALVIFATLASSVSAQELDEFVYLPIIIKSPQPPDCNFYEPNDTSGQANWIQDGETQTHCIVPKTDVDWVKFSVNTESEVILEAADEGGDLELWLYDSDLNELEHTYSWSNEPARISRLCGSYEDSLAAGTYYAKAEHWLNSAEIPDYDITLTVNACPTPDDLVLVQDSLVERFYEWDDITCCGWYIAGEFYNQGSQPIWLDKVYFEFFDENGQLIGYDEARYSGAQGVIEPGESECFALWVDNALEDTGWGSYTMQPIISQYRIEVFNDYTVLEDKLVPHVSGGHQRWTLTLQNNTNKSVQVGGRYKVINDSDGKLAYCGAWGSGPIFNYLSPYETETDEADIILPPEGYTLERDIFGWHTIY
jgi:uncharacterized protein YhfF